MYYYMYNTINGRLSVCAHLHGVIYIYYIYIWGYSHHKSVNKIIHVVDNGPDKLVLSVVSLPGGLIGWYAFTR